MPSYNLLSKCQPRNSAAHHTYFRRDCGMIHTQKDNGAIQTLTMKGSGIIIAHLHPIRDNGMIHHCPMAITHLHPTRDSGMIQLCPMIMTYLLPIRDNGMIHQSPLAMTHFKPTRDNGLTYQYPQLADSCMADDGMNRKANISNTLLESTKVCDIDITVVPAFSPVHVMC